MAQPEDVAVIDPQTAGISGDMLLAALIDLDADVEKISKSLSSLPRHIANCHKVKLETKTVKRCGFRGLQAIVKVKEHYHHRSGAELKKALESYLEASDLTSAAQSLARKTLLTLLKTESKLHLTPVNSVRLHEAGSVDTLADIIGVAVALEDLHLLEGATFYGLPPSVGRGKIKTTHGVLSTPAPATIEILRAMRYPFEGGDVGGEMVTPTGAALLVNLSKPVMAYPPMRVTRIGYGAGSREIVGVPNMLRVTTGRSLAPRYRREEVDIIETNIDDVDGEVIGYLNERLIEAGAKDACTIPTVGKKGRPSLIVHAIANRDDVENLVDVIFRETGSLGVRVHSCSRFTLQRQLHLVQVTLAGRKYKVNVKVARDRVGGATQLKPEFEDVKEVAVKTGLPLKEVTNAVKRKAEELLS